MTPGTPPGHHVSMRVRRSTVVAWVAACSCAAASAAIAFATISANGADRLIAGHVLAGSTAALAFSLIGAAVARRLPSNRVGLLCLGIGASEALSGLVTEYGYRAVMERAGGLPAGEAVASLDAWVWMPGFVAIITLLVAWFPDGRVHRRWVRIPLALAGLGVVGFVVPTAVMAWRLRGPAIFTADRVDDGSRLAGIADAGLFLVLAGAVGCVVSALDRLRRAHGRERQQLLWFAAGAALCVGSLVAARPDSSIAPIAELVALPLIPAAIGMALLRYRLYDMEFVVNRVLLYVGLTATIGVLYVSAVALFTNVLDVGSVPGAVLASGVVAVGFDRVRRALERVADRLLFGNRHDPAAAMVEVTRSVSSVSAPDALDAIAAALVETLKLRAARVALRTVDGTELVGATGVIATPTLSVPLTFENRELGHLEIEAAGGMPFDPAARRLLGDLAAQVAIAAHAILLTTELRKSRARLIEAVEQERRRLRRDLHDGLGTALVGIVMQLEALSNLLDGQGAASDLARTITTEARQLVAETRRLVHGLVPPVVEEVGLVEALRQHADRLNRTGGRRGTFTIDADGWAHERLPAAVEVAAYVIVTEAMTNVARHARATCCEVRLRRDTELTVEVVDDGIGLTGIRREGVGLRSMRERTEDLDGVLVVEPCNGRGTRVAASLPLTVH